MQLRFNLSLCTGCKLCQLACSAYHESVFNPEKSRLRIIHEYRENGIHIEAKRCIFCKKCEETCPEIAISNNGKWMIVNSEKCTGCQACVEICPTQIIFINKHGKAVICDLCDGEPMCAKWCPKEVISLRETPVKMKEAIG